MKTIADRLFLAIISDTSNDTTNDTTNDDEVHEDDEDDKSYQVIKVKEVRIVKEVKKVMAGDVSPVAMFSCEVILSKVEYIKYCEHRGCSELLLGIGSFVPTG